MGPGLAQLLSGCRVWWGQGASSFGVGPSLSRLTCIPSVHGISSVENSSPNFFCGGRFPSALPCGFRWVSPS